MHHLGEAHAFCASDVRDMGRAVLLDCLTQAVSDLLTESLCCFISHRFLMSCDINRRRWRFHVGDVNVNRSANVALGRGGHT